MDERKRQILTVLIISAVVLSYMIITAKPVEKKSFIAATNITNIRLTEKGEVISGSVLFTLALDGRDELAFFPLEAPTLTPGMENVYFPQPLPPGTKIVPSKSFRLIFDRETPIVSGTVVNKNFTFDALYGRYFWPFYELEGDWEAIHIPYIVTIEDVENRIRTVRDRKTIISGPLWGQDIVDLSGGIRIRNIGQISRGLGKPDKDLAFVYGTDGRLKTVKSTDLKTALALNSRTDMPLKGIGLRIKRIDSAKSTLDVSPSEIKLYDGYMMYYFKRGVSLRGVGKEELHFNLFTFQDYVEANLVWIEEGLWGAYCDIIITVEIVRYPTGCPPVKVRVVPPSAVPGGAYVKLYDGRYAWDELSLIGTTFQLKIHCGDASFMPALTWKLQFFTNTNTWNSFVNYVGIDSMTSYLPSNLKLVYERPAFVPSTVVPFDPSAYSLYTPSLKTSPYPLGITTGDRRYTLFGELSSFNYSALITVEVPATLFKYWAYIPAAGKPKVENVKGTTIAGGGRGYISVTVKNIGFTSDMFSMSLDAATMPPVLLVSDLSGASATIRVNETKELSLGLSAGRVEKEETVKLRGRVTCTSGEKADFEVEVKLIPGEAIDVQPLPADLKVRVIDEKTNQPIKNAAVEVSNYLEYTDERGETVTLRLNADPKTGKADYTVTVKKEGYYTRRVTVTVVANTTITKTIFLTPKKKPFPIPTWLIALLVSVGVIGGVLGYLHKTKRLKLHL